MGSVLGLVGPVSVAGRDRKLDAQLVSWYGCASVCLSRSVQDIHFVRCGDMNRPRNRDKKAMHSNRQSDIRRCFFLPIAITGYEKCLSGVTYEIKNVLFSTSEQDSLTQADSRKARSANSCL